MRIAIFIIPFILLTACSQHKSKYADNAIGKPVADQGNAPILSGNYDDALNLAYDTNTNKVTGYFEMERGEDSNGPQFSCAFYLEGKLIDGRAEITTYLPPTKGIDTTGDVVKGVLTAKGNGKFDVKLSGDLPGCSMAAGLQQDSTVNFALTKRHEWTVIKYITADKAYFYTDASETTRRKAYLVKGNVVYIDKTQAGWTHCFYINNKGKSITGWIKIADENQ